MSSWMDFIRFLETYQFIVIHNMHEMATDLAHYRKTFSISTKYMNRVDITNS